MLNGRCGYGCNLGKYTFVGHLGRNVIDYVLVSKDLFKNMPNFAGGDPNVLSDHCDLSFLLPYTYFSNNADTVTDEYEKLNYKYTWSPNTADALKENLLTESTINELYSIQQSLSAAHDDNDFIDNNVNSFVNILENCAASCRKNTHTANYTNNISSNDVSKKQPWYNDLCKDKNVFFMNV